MEAQEAIRGSAVGPVALVGGAVKAVTTGTELGAMVLLEVASKAVGTKVADRAVAEKEPAADRDGRLRIL